MDGKCEKRKLAVQGPFNVQMCDCGAVHLTIGFLTVRLDALAYRDFAYVVDEGLRAIHRGVPGHLTVH